MNRLVARLGCALALVGLYGSAAAAPVPKHLMAKEVPFAYPPAGSVSVYEAEGGTTRTLSVTEHKRQKDGTALVALHETRADGTQRHYMTLSVRPTGVFLVAEQGRDYPTPWCICKLPHKEGDTWTTEGHGADMVAGPVEKVKTPVGEVEAYRVAWEYTPGQTATYWYAPGLGLVRMEGGAKLSIKSFTRGRE